MAHYIIGDIQGCFAELQTLLAKIGFDAGRDTISFAGDLVNRGQQSLAVLRFVKQHDTCMQTVLGNHDLHLLALEYGVGKIKRGDTIGEVLQAADGSHLLAWLRTQPLMINLSNNDVLVHAGLWHQWSIEEAQTLAEEAVRQLRHTPRVFFDYMYGNQPAVWQENLSGQDRIRFIVNTMTRMRAITRKGALDFDFKSTLAEMPPNLNPWFAVAERRNTDKRIVFGHWSALGLHRENNTVCLDSGALWGGELSALCLDNNEIIQVAAQTKQNWQHG
ncbi:symmetrical bis(5'-nucleosyl)-tetraphosphatase [Stenoxybacter acetivorans]|uniref:symmetrical bis(5'-nucleosyl)-tetraphosphatase n=1 Tax=Stenoxybacter acetivorans TaxID=422441 RepID=UPI00055F7ABB|nr:symmetrical bis(5'-nucleosyl)-tetraphosphatase [Stenoxybacter acetivorans]